MKMMSKKKTLRKCIVCNEQKDKDELIRIVKDKNNNVNIDYSGKLNGRGAYICKNEKCLKKAVNNKLLNRHLRINVDNTIYEELEAM